MAFKLFTTPTIKFLKWNLVFVGFFPQKIYIGSNSWLWKNNDEDNNENYYSLALLSTSVTLDFMLLYICYLFSFPENPMKKYIWNYVSNLQMKGWRCREVREFGLWGQGLVLSVASVLNSTWHWLGINAQYIFIKGLPWWFSGKYSAWHAGDTGEIGLTPESGRSPGEGNGNLFQYSCLDNAMDKGVWWATVLGVTESQTRLSDWTHIHS